MTPTEMMVSPGEAEMLRGVFKMVSGRRVKPLAKSRFAKPVRLHLVDVAAGNAREAVITTPQRHPLAETISMMHVVAVNPGAPERIRDLLMRRLPGLRMAA